MQIYAHLMDLYRDPPCPLDHANSFQLLCSVILSAQASQPMRSQAVSALIMRPAKSCRARMQSTDKKVNEIVPPLYALAPDAASMAKLEVRSTNILTQRTSVNVSLHTRSPPVT